MSDELQPGLIGEARTTVDRRNVASTYGSGLIDVFSTPAMIGLMESASKSAVDRLLPEGSITVGTRVDVRHLAATPIGLDVTATAELVEVDGRRLVFKVTAADPKETIGDGTHERMIVDSARLLARAQSKAS